MKVVINNCFGGFGLSDAAYERLIELGVPVQKHIEQERGEDGFYKPQPLNDGEVIFDRRLSGDPRFLDMLGHYWDMWIEDNRTHPLLVQIVEELGEKANGRCASLVIVKIPDGTNYHIEEYDGQESIDEDHRSW